MCVNIFSIRSVCIRMELAHDVYIVIEEYTGQTYLIGCLLMLVSMHVQKVVGKNICMCRRVKQSLRRFGIILERAYIAV